MISIRAAEAADIPALARLFDSYRRFYGRPSDIPAAQSFLQQRHESSDSVILLAAGGAVGDIEGFVQLYPSFSSISCERSFILNDLFVDAVSRGKGVARRLVSAAVAYARGQGAGLMTLTTEVTNLAAQRLYESAGWSRDFEFLNYELLLRRR